MSERTNRWIRDTHELAHLAERLAGVPVAFDLEADSFHHYREKICLAQVSWPDGEALIDPLDGAKLGALRPLLEDPGTRKILHGADYDLRLLDRDHGIRVRGLFETMIASRLVGERAFGLAALLERYFGVRLDKTHQRADWSQRPLPPVLEEYALEDTRHLHRLAVVLEGELERLGRRGWAEEEFGRIEEVRWSRPDPSDPPAWTRVRGAASLDAVGCGVLRALHAWREARAQRRDVPPFRVLGEDPLVELARRRPSGKDGLRAVPHFPAALAASAADEILAAIRAGELAPAEPPAVRRLRRPAPSPATAIQDRLRAARDRVAVELDLEPSLLANRRVLEAVGERLLEGRTWDDVPDLRRWQAEVLRERFTAAARGG